MIPIKLSLVGFTSYREPVQIDFSGFDLACISGSNGSGKSSLLDAITYALYGKARVQNEAIINTTCERAEVSLDFEYEGQVYRVTRVNARGKTSQVDFFIQKPSEEGPAKSWKSLTEHTVRDTDAKIRNTLRLDYDSFVNASFFLQGQADSFATKKPAERKEILSTILGLDQWELYRRAANDKSRQARSEVKSLERDIDLIQEELDKEDQFLHERDLHERDLAILREKVTAHQAQLDTLRAQAQLLANQKQQLQALKNLLDSSSEKFTAKQEQLKEKQAILDQYQQNIAQGEAIESAYQQLTSLRAELDQSDRVSQQFWPLDIKKGQLESQLDNYRESLAKEINLLQTEKKDLEQALQASEQKRAQASLLQDKISTIKAELPDAEVITKEIQYLSSQIEELETENGRLKAQMDELAARKQKVEDAKGAVCPMCGQDLSPQHRAQIIAEINTLGKPLGDAHRANRARAEELKRQKQALETQLAQTRNQEVERLKLQQELALLEQELSQLEQREQTWQAGKASRLEEALAEQEQNSFLPEVRQQLTTISQQLAALAYDQSKHEQLRQQVQDNIQAETAWQRLQIARNSFQHTQTELASRERELALESEALQELQARYKSAEADLVEAQTQAQDSREVEESLASLQEEQDSFNRRLGEIGQSLATIQTQRERQKAMRAQMEVLKEQIRQYVKLETAFGKDGVPAMLIDQALPELQEQANDLLGRLSDYGMSVTFSTQRAYKDAKRQDKMETLDILISDGSGTRDYETYSGGEAFRINFAIRLALSRILARRAGAKLQTLIIDEGFGNQDAQGRQRLIEAINIVGKDFEKILIITHIEELKDYFSNRIEITKTLTGSRAEVILG